MFMGNGEQYIWKPPEDEDVFVLQNKAAGPLGAHTVENIQPSAAAVSERSSACAANCFANVAVCSQWSPLDTIFQSGTASRIHVCSTQFFSGVSTKLHQFS